MECLEPEKIYQPTMNPKWPFPDDLLNQPKTVEVPYVADHLLIRSIGKGAYGEVWVARNLIGGFRAVKIIHRNSFGEERPFEREFEGIRQFEPISRTHPGLVAILHVGKNAAGGYFYYIMELGDDVHTGQRITPSTYTAKTLRSEISSRGKLPREEGLVISLSLASALRHIHRHGLIHRDIKPSNIIFVNGTPKFADVGLVTEAGEAVSFIGSPGYMPPEGPGGPQGDIYSLGKVLFEMFTGASCKEFPELPSEVAKFMADLADERVREIVLRACHPDCHQRFQTADDLYAALAGAAQASHPIQGAVTHAQACRPEAPRPGSTLPAEADRVRQNQNVAIAYKAHAEPDVRVLNLLHDHLTAHGYRVFIDRHLTIGVEWAQEIEKKIRSSDALIVLLSGASNQSEMVAYEVEVARESAHQQGKPVLLPVRVAYGGPLSEPLARILGPLQHCLWEGPDDDRRLLEQVLHALDNPPVAPASNLRNKLEPVGGAVPLDSMFYVVRPADEEFRMAIARRDSIVLVKGARQMGKTSLLARGLQQAREAGAESC